LTVLAGTGRFHLGVERQNIGLEGDRVGHGDDLADLVATHHHETADQIALALAMPCMALAVRKMG